MLKYCLIQTRTTRQKAVGKTLDTKTEPKMDTRLTIRVTMARKPTNGRTERIAVTI